MAVGVDTLALIINAERNGAGAPLAQCAAEGHKRSNSGWHIGS